MNAVRLVALAALMSAVAVVASGCTSADDGKPCSADADCGGTKCENGTCSTAQAVCSSAGNPGSSPSCDGEPCNANASCVSGACAGGKCGPSANKTCGVGLAAPCNVGEGCQQDADCQPDYCDANGNKCAAPPPGAHADGRRNAGETGIDCGGTSGTPCPGGQKCKTSDDCQSNCNAQGVCDPPSATDGKKNQDETDIDCGGAAAPKCLQGKTCKVNADCQLDACATGTCGQPASDDGVKNGSETDVDCGGAGVSEGAFSYQAPRCTEGHTCAAAADCTTNHGCSSKGICTMPSCATAETAGITTCGAGETPEADAKHESCCRSLGLPTRTTRRLDKYEITAGRMRVFVTAAGPNIRQWVADYVQNNPSSQLAGVLAASPVLADIYPAAERFDALSLTAHLSHDIDNYGGIRGCYNGDGDSSANTYWMDAAHYADFGLPPRILDRTISDEKPINCQMAIMLAAFCAWDGGELATLADYWDAWGAADYPWGAAASRPNYNWCNGDFGNGGFQCQCDGAHNTDTCPAGGFDVNGEAGVFYEYPQGTDRTKDNEPLIAAPGRFTTDASSIQSGGESWFDLGGNMAEMTGDFTPGAGDFCDLSAEPAAGAATCTRKENGSPGAADIGPGTHYLNIPNVGIIGDTWEGHQYKRGANNSWPATGQYGKFGGRCVRPVE